MGLNFTKYSSLITDTAEFTTANDDYLVCYMEAKSVLDNIADWQTQKLLATATSATKASVTPTSVAPSIFVATSTVPTLTTKPHSIDGAKGPSLTADGSLKVQMKTPCSAPSTSVYVSTYQNVLPIATSHGRPLSLRQQEQCQCQRQLVQICFQMFNLKLSGLSRQILCQSLKTLALIMALIFKILELIVKTKSVAMGKNNNNALRHHLSNNNDNHLSF
jgi:hypothetical protein